MSVGPNSLTHPINLTVETDLDQLTEVMSWFEQFRKPPLSQQVWLEGQMALVEGFTNAVRHAHHHLPTSTPVLMEVQVTPQMFQIWIWDQGEPFDFANNQDVMLQLTSDPNFEPLEREAHWGSIIFLKLQTDRNWQISYDRPSCDRNCLKLEKTLQSS